MRNYSFLSQTTPWYKNKTESSIFAFNQRTRWYQNKTESPVFALHQRTFWYKRKTQSTFSVLHQRLTYIEQKRVFRRTGKDLVLWPARSHTPSFEALDILLSLALFYSLLPIGKWFYSFTEMISPFMHTYTWYRHHWIEFFTLLILARISFLYYQPMLIGMLSPSCSSSYYNITNILLGDNLLKLSSLSVSHSGASLVVANVNPLDSLMRSFLFLTRSHWHSLLMYNLCCFLSHFQFCLVTLIYDCLVWGDDCPCYHFFFFFFFLPARGVVVVTPMASLASTHFLPHA